MKITGIVETAITVKDVRASVRFYQELFGFEAMVEDTRFAALNVAPGHVLLLFLDGASHEPVVFPEGRGIVPPHGSHGQHHFAFGILPEDFDAWRARVHVESIVNWPLGGRSIYFRDPDRNCVELMTPCVWKNY